MSEFVIMSGAQAIQQTVDGFITAVYAESGAGKTRFCVSAARNNKTLYIDSELSAGKLIHQLDPDKDFISNFDRPAFFDADRLERPISLTEVLEIFEDKELVSQYKVIVLDSLTHILGQEIKNEKMDRGKNVPIQYWGELGARFEDFLAFCQRQGIEIIIALHEEEKEDEGRLVKRPKAVGNMAGTVLFNRADTVLYLFKDGADYVASCDRGATHFVAKNRLGLKNELRNEEINYDSVQKQFPSFTIEPMSADQKKEIAKLQKESDTDLGKLKEKFGIKGEPHSVDAIRMVDYMKDKIKYLNSQKKDGEDKKS